jgi:hypothetical protein
MQYNDPRNFLSRDLLNCLSELGFCETVGYGDSLEVRVARPVLARLPSRDIRALLCGARTSSFFERFRSESERLGLSLSEERAEPSKLQGFLELVPSAVIVSANDADTLAALATSLDLPYQANQPPAWLALWASPSLKEFEDFWEINSANEEVMQNVGHRFFDPETLEWIEGDSSSIAEGYALGRQGYDFTLYHREGGILEIANSSSERPLDLSWAKWLIIQQARHTLAAYDPQRERFAIPNWCPFPILLGRALALCSGKAAKVWPGKDCYNIAGTLRDFRLRIYESVPPIFPRLIEKILRITIARCDVLTHAEAIKDHYA